MDSFQSSTTGLIRTFEQAGGGMAVVDPAGRLTDVNPALCRLTGRPSGTLAATTLPALHHPGDPDATITLDSQVTMLQSERQLLGASGEVVPVLLTILPLDERGGRRRTLAHAQPLATAGGATQAAREAAAAALALRVLGGQALSNLLSATVRELADLLGMERTAAMQLVEGPRGGRSLRLRAARGGWDETLHAAAVRTAGKAGESLASASPLPLADEWLSGAVARIGPADAPIGLLAACTSTPPGHLPSGLDHTGCEFLQRIADLLVEAPWPGAAPARVHQQPA